MTRGVEASHASVQPDDSADEVARRLQQVDALRRRVLNVIPHALRTPITTFRGLAEALPGASDDDIRTRIAPALQRLAAQAERLLDDMLLASGLTTTLPTTKPEPVAVLALAKDVWRNVAPAADALVVDGGDVVVVAPPGSLFKILVHVLDNAAKYGESPTLLRLQRGDRMAAISVESPGADVVEVDMLLEPFFRGERAVMNAAGLGVGLTVARALAEHAGGSVEVMRREGGGLVTTVELPVA